MKPPFTEPVEFKEAVAALQAKQDKTTALKSAEIAKLWSDETRRKAFFSARVASASALSELHKRLLQVQTGEMTSAQAVNLLQIWMDGDGKNMLAEMGFSPPSAGSEAITELGSTRRLQLIVYQNTKMAEEVGHYKQWMEHAETHPYGRWHVGVSKIHREAHLARDGMVFKWDHPVWTEDPPGGAFNCHCWREELTAAQVKESGAVPTGDDYQVEPSQLGFDPSQGIDQPIPEKPGMPPEIRDELRKALATVEVQKPPEPKKSEPHDKQEPSIPEAVSKSQTWLQDQLGTNLQVHNTEAPSVQTNILELRQIPEPILKKLKAANIKVEIRDTTVPGFPGFEHLSGTKPPGYPADSTWDTVPGCFDSTTGRVLLGKGTHGSANMPAHEVVHAIGDAFGLDDSQELIAHHARLHHKLHPYQKQDGPGGRGGRKEMLAESAALLVAMGVKWTEGRYDRLYVRWLRDKLSI